jgi:hypothetical protein
MAEQVAQQLLDLRGAERGKWELTVVGAAHPLG